MARMADDKLKFQANGRRYTIDFNRGRLFVQGDSRGFLLGRTDDGSCVASGKGDTMVVILDQPLPDSIVSFPNRTSIQVTYATACRIERAERAFAIWKLMAKKEGLA